MQLRSPLRVIQTVLTLQSITPYYSLCQEAMYTMVILRYSKKAKHKKGKRLHDQKNTADNLPGEAN